MGDLLDVVVGLGANLGPLRQTLAQAVDAIGRTGRVGAVSALYESPPVGPPQPAYLNAAARVTTQLAPRALLEFLLQVERAHGRERTQRWGPRTLDLDILWLAGSTVSEPGLSVPHEHLTERLFALLPLLDVAPEAADPRTGESYRSIARRLDPAGASRVPGSERGGWLRDRA